MASSSSRCLQILLAIFSMLNILIGVAIGLGGGYALSVAESSQVKSVGIAFLCCGILATISGLMGFFGSSCRNKTLLIIYSVTIFLLAATQATIGGLSLANSIDESSVNEYSDLFWGNIPNEWRNYYQETFNCCGYRSLIDQPGSECASLTPCASSFRAHIKLLSQALGGLLVANAALELGMIAVAIIIAYETPYVGKV